MATKTIIVLKTNLHLLELQGVLALSRDVIQNPHLDLDFSFIDRKHFTPTLRSTFINKYCFFPPLKKSMLLQTENKQRSHLE